MIVISETCIDCGANHDLSVNTADYQDWKSGKLIQNAMPYLSADDRELLISGICGQCFDAMFGE